MSTKTEANLLQSVESRELYLNQRAMFNVLKATLEYPTNSQAKAAKLADDLKFFCSAVEEGPDNILWQLWPLVIDIVSCIPPYHPWQDSLVLSMGILRQQDVPISKFYDENRLAVWKDLPDLPLSIREAWLGIDSDPTLDGEESEKIFASWRSLNSFTSRITSADFVQWLNLPIWNLREAFEEPPLKGSAMDCHIWVAAEWIINCADVLFEYLSSNTPLDAHQARSLRTGSLCEDIKPLSVERWDFWKRRFSELAADADGLGLGDTSLERITEALKSMENIEG
ncbi:hypothetical protein SLS53_004840 [Cytospora paraplurivora]|uniref:Uncharacterized protein n=1 Tax=Cytospora paraplurivora TaxID=2898453 RepID=A0AAN9U744_9PEZI